MALMAASISSISRSRTAIAAAVKKGATTGNPNALAECMEALITVLKYALKQIKGERSIFIMFLVTRQREKMFRNIIRSWVPQSTLLAHTRKEL